jgi:hypothetical protein
MPETKETKCAGCGRKINDINTGASKNINGKWYCSNACWREHAGKK